MMMTNNDVKHSWIEIFAYTFLAFAAVGFVYYLFYFDPVNYVRLISEDQWGEYSTSVCFCLSAILLLVLSCKKGPRYRRLIWAIIGLAAILIAGEEISWGQRIFGVSTPDFLLRHNLQGEISIHNIAAFERVYRNEYIAILVLAWSLFPIVASIWMPSILDKIKKTGLPLIPMRLVAIFLTIPYFYYFFKFSNNEVMELFMGISAAVWSVDLFNKYGWERRPNVLSAGGVMACMLFLVVYISGNLAYRCPSFANFGWRLNFTPIFQYSKLGMFDQAQKLYEYINKHPYYIMPYTRINHGMMLLTTGKSREAFHVLTQELTESETLNAQEPQSTDNARRLGIIFKLLKEDDKANAKFDLAIDLAQENLAYTSNPDRKAELLWSIAKTLEARGDLAPALAKARQAKNNVNSPSLGLKIKYWIGDFITAYGSKNSDIINSGMISRLIQYPD